MSDDARSRRLVTGFDCQKIGLAITAALIGVGFLEIVALLVLGVLCLLSRG